MSALPRKNDAYARIATHGFALNLITIPQKKAPVHPTEALRLF